jgi:hypothetical protein
VIQLGEGAAAEHVDDAAELRPLRVVLSQRKAPRAQDSM